MVVPLCLDKEVIEEYKRGNNLSSDLKKVLDESGDPYWVECLLKDFREKFFSNNDADYYNFAKVVDFSLGFSLYLREQSKRFRKAYELKSFRLGRKLTSLEEIEELENNHISKDFRLYFLLEHPEYCGIDEEKVEINPFYRDALNWLLSSAELINNFCYKDIIKTNTAKLKERRFALAS